MLTPYDVHHGLAELRLAVRAGVLAAAYAAHPERFPRGVPTPGPLPEAVWINQPAEGACAEQTEFAACPRRDDLEPPRESSTPASEGITSSEEKLMLGRRFTKLEPPVSHLR